MNRQRSDEVEKALAALSEFGKYTHAETIRAYIASLEGSVPSQQSDEDAAREIWRDGDIVFVEDGKSYERTVAKLALHLARHRHSAEMATVAALGSVPSRSAVEVANRVLNTCVGNDNFLMYAEAAAIIQQAIDGARAAALEEAARLVETHAVVQSGQYVKVHENPPAASNFEKMGCAIRALAEQPAVPKGGE